MPLCLTMLAAVTGSEVLLARAARQNMNHISARRQDDAGDAAALVCVGHYAHSCCHVQLRAGERWAPFVGVGHQLRGLSFLARSEDYLAAERPVHRSLVGQAGDQACNADASEQDHTLQRHQRHGHIACRFSRCNGVQDVQVL